MKALLAALLLLPAASRAAEPKALGPLDVLAVCPDADARTFRAWTLDEAAAHLKACLAKVYAAPDAALVKGEAGKDGKRLLVVLKRPLDAEDAERLRAAVKRRRGRLYGYPALVTTAKTAGR